MSASDDRGSASIWLVAGAALLLVVALVATLRGAATLARHRAEAAADAAALAAAAQIGITGQACAAARAMAAANAAFMTNCRLTLAADGRSGQVEIAVRVEVDLPLLGADRVEAAARAERERS